MLPGEAIDMLSVIPGTWRTNKMEFITRFGWETARLGVKAAVELLLLAHDSTKRNAVMFLETGSIYDRLGKMGSCTEFGVDLYKVLQYRLIAFRPWHPYYDTDEKLTRFSFV